MASAEYGPLFTAADMQAAIDIAADEGAGSGAHPRLDEVLEILAVERYSLTFPADEPLFVLRGSDPAAPDALASPPNNWSLQSFNYHASCHLVGASRAYQETVKRVAKAMREWQAANPDRVKTPQQSQCPESWPTGNGLVRCRLPVGHNPPHAGTPDTEVS